eukprot:m.182396 g.182396  ORF g.182396 m.182396 type:complete len:443 (-) comp32113_c0_seq1:16-1344(-)
MIGAMLFMYTCSCLAAFTFVASASSQSEGSWSIVQPQHSNQDGTRPTVRYSHSTTLVNNLMVVTHGYYYDHGQRDIGLASKGPQWLDDTWLYDIDAGNVGTNNPWKRMTPAGPRPHGRMSHSAIYLNGRFLLFGGDDGGHRDQAARGYQGNFLSDLWELDVNTGYWTELIQPAGDIIPDEGYAHHGVLGLGKHMYIIGGLRRDTIWRYDLDSHAWEKVEHLSAMSPGKRHGISVATDEVDGGFYLFGGFAFKDDITEEQSYLKSGPLQDLWHFTVKTREWKLIQETHPTGARTYASAALINSPLASAHNIKDPVLLIFAGANCAGSCNCFGDTWLFSIHEQKWSRLEVNEEPITRYKQGAIIYQSALYTFGGESYKPYMYHNGISKLYWGDTNGQEALSNTNSSNSDSPFVGFELFLIFVVCLGIVMFSYLLKSRDVDRKLH